MSPAGRVVPLHPQGLFSVDMVVFLASSFGLWAIHKKDAQTHANVRQYESKLLFWRFRFLLSELW